MELPELPPPDVWVREDFGLGDSTVHRGWSEDQMREYARQAVLAERERIQAAVMALLEGIDMTECEDDKGWWETSTGAEFGAKTRAAIAAAIRGEGSQDAAG